MKFPPRLSILAALAALAITADGRFAQGATIWTLDGKIYEGDAKFDPADGLVVTPKGAAALKVPFANILMANIGQAKFLSNGATDPGQLRMSDVGNVTKAGSCNFLQGMYTLKANGTGIIGNQDSFYFGAAPFYGDGCVTARVAELTPAKNATASCGITFRASANPYNAQVSLTINSDGELQFIGRMRADSTSMVAFRKAKVKLPLWLRLTRRNNREFVAEISEDGKKWDEFARAGDARDPVDRKRPVYPAVPMGTSCVVGLVMSGGNGQEQSTATIDSYSTRENQGDNFKGDSTVPPTFVSTPLEFVGRGILLKSGSFLANAQIVDSDGTRLQFSYGENKPSVPLAQVARVTIEPLSSGLAARIPADRVGVLARNADFMEGEITSISRENVKVSSVIFGNSSFRLDNGQTSAVVFRPPEPADAAFRILLNDGSILLAESLKPNNDHLIIQERTMGRMSVSMSEVYVIRASADHASSAYMLKPSKVDGPDSYDPAAVSLFDKVQGAWMLLPGGPAAEGIVSPGGGTISYALAGKYKSLVCRIGIPDRVPPRNTARFIVLADDKEVFKSKSVSSKDAAQTITVPLAGAKNLTLKVEADSTADAATFGVWGDPMLVR